MLPSFCLCRVLWSGPQNRSPCQHPLLLGRSYADWDSSFTMGVSADVSADSVGDFCACSSLRYFAFKSLSVFIISPIKFSLNVFLKASLSLKLLTKSLIFLAKKIPSPSRSLLKTSVHRYFSTLLANLAWSIFLFAPSPSASIKKRPSCLSSALKTFASAIFLFMVSRKASQQIPVSLISANACFLWLSSASSHVKLLSISSISQRRWKALSRVNTFWSLVFIVA